MLRKMNFNNISRDLDKTYLFEFSEFNGCLISFCRINSDSCWFASEQSDRFVLLLRGNLVIIMENDVIQLEENEGVFIPKGILYKPETTDTASILIIESKPVWKE